MTSFDHPIHLGVAQGSDEEEEASHHLDEECAFRVQEIRGMKLTLKEFMNPINLITLNTCFHCTMNAWSFMRRIWTSNGEDRGDSQDFEGRKVVFCKMSLDLAWPEVISRVSI